MQIPPYHTPSFGSWAAFGCHPALRSWTQLLKTIFFQPFFFFFCPKKINKIPKEGKNLKLLKITIFSFQPASGCACNSKLFKIHNNMYYWVNRFVTCLNLSKSYQVLDAVHVEPSHPYGAIRAPVTNTEKVLIFIGFDMYVTSFSNISYCINCE